MESFVKNICTKNYQYLTTGFQVTIENVGDVFWGHSVVTHWWKTFVDPLPVPRIKRSHGEKNYRIVIISLTYVGFLLQFYCVFYGLLYGCVLLFETNIK